VVRRNNPKSKNDPTHAITNINTIASFTSHRPVTAAINM